MNNLSLASALLFEPRKAFDEIGQRPRYGFALLLAIASSVAVIVWYRSVVDLAWLTDQTLRANQFVLSRLSEAQIEEQVKRASERSGLGTVFAGVGTALGTVIAYLISTLYMMLAGKITNVQRSFRQWFAFISWANLPNALSLIPSGFVLLSATTTQILQADLKPLSLNALLFQLAPTEPGYTLLSYIDLIQIFCMYLSVVGVKVWSGRSWLFSTVFALLPAALVFGIWALISLR
jgi:hypothetical protein